MKKTNAINEFKGLYAWLSNFAPCKIIFRGETYRSVEHAYMSAKSNRLAWKVFCQITKSPARVKKASYNIKLVFCWEDIKIDVMKECLEQKYTQEPYKTKLLGTGDAYIVEGNYHKDTLWGVSLVTGRGQNKLGLLIMDIRSRLQSNDLL